MKIEEEFALMALEQAVIELVRTKTKQTENFINYYLHQALAEVVGDLVAKKAVIYCKADSHKVFVSIVYNWGGFQHRWTNSFSKGDIRKYLLPDLVKVAVANIKADARRTMELSGRSQNKNV